MDRGATTGAGAPASFTATAARVLGDLAPLAGGDWSARAGELEWSCEQTAVHVVDCLLSYTLQLGARRTDGWLPLEPVRASASATPPDLLDALAAACATFSAVLAVTPPAVTATDGVAALAVGDWAARGAYELLVHGHDIAAGLGGTIDPPDALCAWILSSPDLWMVDRARAESGARPWAQLLLGSGRTAPPV